MKTVILNWDPAFFSYSMLHNTLKWQEGLLQMGSTFC